MTIKHILTPFNGMKSGFKNDGLQDQYSAQISTMKGISDFTTQNLASTPVYRFGYFEMLYDAINSSMIQIKFSLPPIMDFKVILYIIANVVDSKFVFSGIGNDVTMIATHLNENVLTVDFTGNPTGEYLLNIYPTYQLNATHFNLTKIEIVTN